ncbi:nuclear transport factor 2 family protein [Enterococcus avium]|uniref:nuclear transport factor 2 family protein n=1 Tax=Enterococcus avium TaxID=33945 RepID=UPI0034D36ED7
MKVTYGTTPKRKAIKETFEVFLEAVKNGDQEKISSLISEECVADLSINGTHKGAKNVAKAFEWKGPKLDEKKFTVTNFVCRTKDHFAQQSAYIQVLLGHYENGFLYPFEFGGEMVLSYENKEDQWEITSIKFDMAWEKGNTYFAKEWKFIDYTQHKGGNNTIVSEYDAPWRVIPETDEEISDVEKIADSFSRYAWGLDNTDFNISKSCFTEDVYAIMPHDNYSGSRQLISFFKNVNHKEAAVQHAARIVDISFNDQKDQAVVEMFRIEPHRLGSKVLNKENVHYNFYSARYLCDMVKENGEWKFKKIDYKAKVFFEIPEDASMFIDEI